MPLDPRTAADIAAKHGLSPGDAVALQRLTDGEDDAEDLAEDLAGKFADDDDAPSAAETADTIRSRGGALS